MNLFWNKKTQAKSDHPHGNQAFVDEELRLAENALSVLAAGMASVSDDDFFPSLVKSLASALAVPCALVSECVGADNRRVRTLAFMKQGQLADNFEYDLKGTPCEIVMQDETCFVAKNLEDLYPVEVGLESYLGVPALDHTGRVLGHLAILDTKEMHYLPHAESILRIFAARAGVELHRKRTQEALQASEEKYRLLVENQTDLVVKLDSQGNFQFVSPSYCEMFACTETDILGTAFNDHILTGDRNSAKNAWQKLFSEPWMTESEHCVRTGSGERWLAWALKALRDDVGNVVEIIGVGRDVTDRRQAEEQARQNLQALAHAGRVQSMGEMASTLAHELNQPLTAILSFSQASQRVLKNEEFDQKELAFALERIAVNAKRAGDIISHMRGFIRKEEPSTEPADINYLIRDTIDLVNSELLQNGIDPVLDLQQNLPAVCVDPIQIQQVVLNLVRNSMEAIQKNKNGERCITVATRLDGKSAVEVTVTDTGPGLDKGITDKVFTTFMTTKTEGMGIGLPICKSIIEAHGGSLSTRPRLGGGAIFSFELPLDDKEGSHE